MFLLPTVRVAGEDRFLLVKKAAGTAASIITGGDLEGGRGAEEEGSERGWFGHPARLGD